MNKYTVLAITVFFLAACESTSTKKGQSEDGKKLTIAVAANVQFAMEDLEELYEKETSNEIDVITSSSGKLTTQIQQGAPYDIFLSANMKYPRALYQEGYATAQPKVYAFGSLVIWNLKEISLSDDLPGILLDPEVVKIAIANPRNAPYGEQTINVLENIGLLSEVESKLVYGENIAQTNQYIMSRACDIGFTAKSVVISPELRGRGYWHEIRSDLYQPIEQGVIITGHGHDTKPEQCQEFVDFLFSPAAQNILRKYGYKLPEKDSVH